MKQKKHLWVLVIAIAFLALPIILNFVLLIPSPIPQQWLIGEPDYWLTYWPTYVGAIGTLLMAIMTYKTLQQNSIILKKQETPKVSCSLAIGKDCIYIEVKNIASVPAHNVKISLINNTSKKSIYRFNELCNHLENMSFEISPFEIKRIPIYGIQPYVEGKYEGFITANLSCCGETESFDLYLEEINVSLWDYNTRDVCNFLSDISSSIDVIKGKLD